MGEIHSSCGKLAGGLSSSPSLGVGTSIMHCATIEGKGVWLLTKKKSWPMDMTLKHQPSINSMDASGTDVLAWDLMMVSTRKL